MAKATQKHGVYMNRAVEAADAINGHLSAGRTDETGAQLTFLSEILKQTAATNDLLVILIEKLTQKEQK